MGGIKEKVLAAHRAGLKRVVMPERNAKDLVDVPDEIKATMEFLFAGRVQHLLQWALERPATGSEAAFQEQQATARQPIQEPLPVEVSVAWAPISA